MRRPRGDPFARLCLYLERGEANTQGLGRARGSMACRGRGVGIMNVPWSDANPIVCAKATLVPAPSIQGKSRSHHQTDDTY